MELLLPTDLVHAPCHSAANNPDAAPQAPTLTGNIDVMSVSVDPFDSAIHTLDLEDSMSGSLSSHDHGVRVAHDAVDMPEDDAAADIGPATRDVYAAALRGCRTILWTGPMGQFEGGSFSGGTLAVAQAIAKETANGATTIVGGAMPASSSHAPAHTQGHSHALWPCRVQHSEGPRGESCTAARRTVCAV